MRKDRNCSHGTSVDNLLVCPTVEESILGTVLDI